jgi:hypothetical protein
VIKKKRGCSKGDYSYDMRGKRVFQWSKALRRKLVPDGCTASKQEIGTYDVILRRL